MYFMPLLAGLISLLLLPSYIIAAFVAFGVYFFLTNGGQKLDFGIGTIRGQLAFRVLCAKLLAQNGPMSEYTQLVHARITVDADHTEDYRGQLRDVAVLTGDGWRVFAREVKHIYRKDPEAMLQRYKAIFEQLAASTNDISPESQLRMIELGKSWGIGGQRAREFFTQYSKNDPIEELLKF